jgi:hypothetical protein
MKQTTDVALAVWFLPLSFLVNHEISNIGKILGLGGIMKIQECVLAAVYSILNAVMLHVYLVHLPY